MTGATTLLAELLAYCDAHGVRLLPAGDGGLTIDAPQAALTPALLEFLAAHKADVLATFRPADATPRCRCGSTTWRDVAIHGGQSVRRDCAGCGRFIDFPLWHGANTGHNGQHTIGYPHGEKAT
jgi:hypothetical protein